MQIVNDEKTQFGVQIISQNISVFNLKSTMLIQFKVLFTLLVIEWLFLRLLDFYGWLVID